MKEGKLERKSVFPFRLYIDDEPRVNWSINIFLSDPRSDAGKLDVSVLRKQKKVNFDGLLEAS